MTARAAAPRATSEPMVARGAPAVETPGVLLEAGSVGIPLETTVLVTETSEEAGVPEPEGTMRVVVPDAGGAPVSEDGAGMAGCAPEVGIGCPGGGKMTLVVVTTTLDSAGGGAAYEPEAVGGISVTVTVTAGPQAQLAGRYVSYCNTLRSPSGRGLLTLDGDDSQRKRSDGEELEAEHVDSG